jgi:hypothetical protein
MLELVELVKRRQKLLLMINRIPVIAKIRAHCHAMLARVEPLFPAISIIKI